MKHGTRCIRLPLARYPPVLRVCPARATGRGNVCKGRPGYVMRSSSPPAGGEEPEPGSDSRDALPVIVVAGIPVSKPVRYGCVPVKNPPLEPRILGKCTRPGELSRKVRRTVRHPLFVFPTIFTAAALIRLRLERIPAPSHQVPEEGQNVPVLTRLGRPGRGAPRQSRVCLQRN